MLVALSSTIVSECADASTHGKDLLFLDADGITVLDYEIDTWDPAASSSVWVRVPQINASSAVDFIWFPKLGAAARGLVASLPHRRMALVGGRGRPWNRPTLSQLRT